MPSLEDSTLVHRLPPRRPWDTRALILDGTGGFKSAPVFPGRFSFCRARRVSCKSGAFLALSSAFMKTVARCLLVAALMTSIGLHWAVLQSAAWVGMAVAYSVERGSVVQGLSDTFDGEHPCPLCQAVSEGVKDGPGTDGPAPVKPAKELTLALVSIPVFIFSASPPVFWSTTSETAKGRGQAPLAPPPRTLA